MATIEVYDPATDQPVDVEVVHPGEPFLLVSYVDDDGRHYAAHDRWQRLIEVRTIPDPGWTWIAIKRWAGEFEPPTSPENTSLEEDN